MSEIPTAIALSLIAHTNVGKTALARTLLKRDVGEVRDDAHVTLVAERHTMIETPQGDTLCLWDTPGFGDSARLARRLATLDRPMVGFLAMAWDRWRDRRCGRASRRCATCATKRMSCCISSTRRRSPSDAGYIAPELQILEWIGKPVVVLLNQTGTPRAAAVEAAEIERWRQALGSRSWMHGVLALDAFARCWVQERTWLRAVAGALSEAKQPAFARLAAAWQADSEAQFDAAMDAIAEPIARAACDRAPVADAGLRGSLVEVGKAIGLANDRIDPAKQVAMRTLADRLDADTRSGMDRLIAIHGLDGRAAAEVMTRLADSVTAEAPVDERKAAVIGGFVSGALTGLAADIASGGLTFGAGLLAGGIVGAVGAAGVARGFNLVRGKTQASIRWSDEFVAALVPAAVLRYLAVAHYGRGRGEWVASEYPPFWRDAVVDAVARTGGVATIVALRAADNCNVQSLATAWQRKLREITLAVLAALYPDAAPAAARPDGQ